MKQSSMMGVSLNIPVRFVMSPFWLLFSRRSTETELKISDLSTSLCTNFAAFFSNYFVVAVSYRYSISHLKNGTLKDSQWSFGFGHMAG